MTRVRRLLLLLLIATVPMQAALGATGLHRVTDTHPVQEAWHTHLGHDAAASGHSHESDVGNEQNGSIANPSPFPSHGAAGKCKLCSECCSSSVAIPAAAQEVMSPPDAPLRVSMFVEPEPEFQAGDELFRPPRTTVA